MDGDKPPDKPQSWQHVHIWQIQAVRDAALIALVIGVIYLGEVLSVITVPILVALGFAYLIEPVVNWLTRTLPWLGRQGAVLCMMGITALLLIIMVVGTVPLVLQQAQGFMANSGKYVAQIRAFAEDRDVPKWLQERLAAISAALPATARTAPATAEPTTANKSPDTPAITNAPAAENLSEERVRMLIREELAGQHASQQTDSALSKVASGFMPVIGFFTALIGGVAQLGIFLFVCAFCFFFFSVSFPAVRHYIQSFIPAHNKERTLYLIGRMDGAISGFVRGRLTICFVMGLMYALGWTLCGVPHAILLGLITGALGLVPYLSVVGLPIAWALLIVSLSGATDKTGFYYTPAADGAVAGLAWWKIITFPLLVNVITQTVEDYVLNPMIQGKATNLHPATILLACIAGGVLGGLYGMILAIPVTACLKIMMDEVLLPRLKLWLEGKRNDPLPLG
jgi:predicted PurR-regulated permease PerM